jgi:tetratricopeptide (TPR) repeat protein
LLRARAYIELGHVTDAVPLLREGVQEVEQDDDLHFRAQYRYVFGGALYTAGSYDEAHIQLRHALEDVQESGEDPILTGKIMVGIGHILFKQRDIDRAIGHYRSAVEFFGAVRDYYTQGTIYAGLSLAFKRKGNWEKSLEYARLGAAMFRASNDMRAMAQVLNNMAVALQEHGNLEEAEQVAQQALTRAQQVQAVDTEAAAHSTLAAIYFAGGNLDQASQEAAMARDLAQDDNDPARIGSWITLAQIADRHGDLDRADELYRLALEHLKEADLRTRYAEVALAYSDLLQKRGDMAGALNYAREAARLQVAQAPGA